MLAYELFTVITKSIHKYPSVDINSIQDQILQYQSENVLFKSDVTLHVVAILNITCIY